MTANVTLEVGALAHAGQFDITVVADRDTGSLDVSSAAQGDRCGPGGAARLRCMITGTVRYVIER